MKPPSRLVLCSLLLSLMFLLQFQASAQVTRADEKEIRIGVLAKRGDKKTIQRWQPTADYLSKEINKQILKKAAIYEKEGLLKKGKKRKRPE